MNAAFVLTDEHVHWRTSRVSEIDSIGTRDREEIAGGNSLNERLPAIEGMAKITPISAGALWDYGFIPARRKLWTHTTDSARRSLDPFGISGTVNAGRFTDAEAQLRGYKIAALVWNLLRETGCRIWADQRVRRPRDLLEPVEN